MKTKRIFALILAASMMLLSLSFVAFATENEIVFDSEGEAASKNRGVIYSCVYDIESQKVIINGSVTHDIFIAHRDYTINLYKISPEHTLKTALSESEVTLLASASISIKFNFTADVSEINDIFSQYVVTLVSKSGNVDYVGERLYPFVESNCSSDIDRTKYKGVRIPETQEILQTEPSVAIVPIYLDKLMSSSATGYLYSLEGTHTFFDKEYVDSVDRTVRSLCSGDAKIYLQLLLNSGADSVGEATYDIPDMFSDSGIKEIYSYCDFLSDRYSSYKNGFIDGFIIGKNLDDIERYNNNRYGDEEKYTHALALYGVVVGGATRKNIPSADILYSFTNANTYGDEYKEELAFASSRMIEKISGHFDEFYSEGFDFSVTLESSHRPLSIKDGKLNVQTNIDEEYNAKYVNEQNIGAFSDFLESLEKKYSSAPKKFIYVWNPDRELEGNALSCAYAYLYYKLFSQQRLSAFVVGFDENPRVAGELINVVKYIDTEAGVDTTTRFLTVFGENSWGKVISNFTPQDFVSRSHQTISAPDNFSEDMSGEFLYFDFSDYSNYDSWFAGRGFGSISIDYHKEIGRSLCAQFNTDTLSQLEYAYLFNSYEYPENFTYTPYLTLTLAIEGNRDTTDIFEIQVAFENESNVYEASRIIHTGGAVYLHLDVSEFSSEYIAENIRISLRSMSETEGDYRLFISSLKGDSKELGDDELKIKIDEERLRIRDSLVDEEDDENSQSVIITVILAALAAVILTVTIFFFLRKEDVENEEDDE